MQEGPLFSIPSPAFIDSAIPLLGIYPEKTIFQKDICTPIFIAALFTIARAWKQPKCPLTWIDKEEVLHKYKELLLSHKEEQNSAMCSNVNDPRDCHTEWSKSEKQISYFNAYIYIYIYGLQWYRCIYLQGRNRDADVENGRVGMGVKGGRWDELRDWSWCVCTAPC